MTNRFHLSMDSWGTKLVALAMFAFLATNTWHFISTFIPDDTWYHRPAMFTFFEGGLLYWFNRLEHASENVGKTIVAAVMTLVQLGAVGFATLYELSVGFQQMLNIQMDTAVQQDMPFVVTGLIIIWIIAWALGRLFNHHFGARIGYIARHGVAPHIDGVDVGLLAPDGRIARPMAGMTVSADPAPVASLAAPSGASASVPALPAAGQSGASQPTTPAAPASQPVSQPVTQPAAIPALANGLARAAGAVAGWFGGARGDAQAASLQQSATLSAPPVAPSGSSQGGTTRNPQQGQQAGQQANPADALSPVERKVLDAFLGLSAEEQKEIQEYAAAHDVPELLAWLKARYKQAARFLDAPLVRHVMSAWEAILQQQAAAARPKKARTSAPRRPAATGAASTSTRKASASKGGSGRKAPAWDKILASLSKEPENQALNDAELAAVAGCSPSMVSRWRAKEAKLAAEAAQPVQA